jgi:subfamily B ATP-binding cassette protein MsbA
VNSLKRFFPYYGLLAPYKWPFLGALVCAILYGAASGLGFPMVVKENIPIIFASDTQLDVEQFKRAADLIAEEGAANLTRDDWLDRLSTDLGISRRDSEHLLDQTLSDRLPKPDNAEAVLLRTVLLLPLAILIRAVAGFLNVYLIAYCGVKVLEQVRTRVFAKIQALHIGYFQETNRGDLLSRLMVDCNLVKNCIVTVSNSLVREPFTFLFAFSYLIYLSITHRENLFLLCCLAAVPICVFPIRYIGKRLTRKAKQLQRQTGNVTEVASENLGATREIRAFSLEAAEEAKFKNAVAKFLRSQLKVVKYDKSLSPLIELITGLVITAAIYFAARSQLNLRVDEVVALFLALHMCYEPIKKIGGINNELKRGVASLDRIEEVLHADVQIKDKPDAMALTAPVEGRIHFENVSFHYQEPSDQPVLRQIDCVLNPGKAYALVGPSGAGKSTFINLVLRFYDPTEGRILLDGHDLRDLRLLDLRHQIGLVPQDPILFNDTIVENIRLSRPEASPEEILQAAEKANARDFIEQEPEGFDTVVGDRGTRLSGGQKQRIAIARAFLRNPPILILDEASSALDSESESRVQAELQSLMKGKTVLMIAHRFATLKLADEILVFEKGQITARGDHATLMTSSPTYQKLYEKQELS